MGYTGRIDKNKRFRGVVIDELNRTILTGLEMLQIIQEVRDSNKNPHYANLDMRIGIHTGRDVAGIIGSKVVRYDIFGEGVLTAYKMETNGEAGQVNISDDTRKLLMT